jgi:ankyrin repeat protein
MLACLHEHCEVVQALASKGADLNYQKRDGTAAIHLAATRQPNVLKVLLEAGADVNLQNREGKTALMLAIEHQEFENFRLLILNKPDPKLKDSDGNRAIDLADEEN